MKMRVENNEETEREERLTSQNKVLHDVKTTVKDKLMQSHYETEILSVQII